MQAPDYIAGVAIAQGKLKPVLEGYAAKGVPIAVVYPQKRYLSAKVRAFIDFMVELMAQLQLLDAPQARSSHCLRSLC